MSYRTNKYLGGAESAYITGRVTFVIVGAPLLISTGSLSYLLVNYWDLYVNRVAESILLVVSLVFSIILYVSSIATLLTLQKYTNRELYNMKHEKFSSNMLAKILALYNSISPGCVRQGIAL